MRKQTGLSLEERCQHFLREFPSAKMHPTLLQQVYQVKKIKKRRIKWTKQAPEPTSTSSKQTVAKMKKELDKAKKDGFRICYLDETVFTRKTVPKAEYCLPGRNMTVDQAKLEEPTLAMLMGISKEKG